jgi:hypothetical protein
MEPIDAVEDIPRSRWKLVRVNADRVNLVN